jgi:hypothetical protein
MLAAPVVLALLWGSELLTRRSAEQQLAAIEAARAIPDEENAAVIYPEVLATTDLVSGRPDFLRTEAMSGPWLSADHPESADWLRGHQNEISRLLEASQKHKCHFPIPRPEAWSRESSRLQAWRRWGQLLLAAANNDRAEGRTDAALEKYRCVIRMGAHMRQQPVGIHFLVGIAIDGLAQGQLKSLVVRGDMTDARLDTIEQCAGSTADNWDKVWPELLETKALHARLHAGNWGFLGWFKYIFGSKRDLSGEVRNRYVGLLAAHRSSRILVAVRKYKNHNGRWPESLEHVRSLAPAEAFVDPSNGDSFVYRLREDEFILYSRGQNNIDEDAQYNAKYDSESGKLRILQDDQLFWPPESMLHEMDEEHAEQGQS